MDITAGATRAWTNVDDRKHLVRITALLCNLKSAKLKPCVTKDLRPVRADCCHQPANTFWAEFTGPSSCGGCMVKARTDQTTRAAHPDCRTSNPPSPDVVSSTSFCSSP